MGLRSPFRVLTRMQNGEPGPAADRQIIAFSDRNDILSWLVQTQNLQLPADKVS